MPQCDRIRNQLSYYLVGGLRPRARGRVAAHLKQCPSCRAELAALERTGALLARAGPAQAPAETWESVQQAILARPRPHREPRRGTTWRWAVSVAILVLVVLGLLVVRSHRPAPPAMVVTAEVDEDLQATMEAHLSAMWAAPLADEAAVGLRLAELEGG
jgi:anti-sigma factor RsiW